MKADFSFGIFVDLRVNLFILWSSNDKVHLIEDIEFIATLKKIQTKIRCLDP